MATHETLDIWKMSVDLVELIYKLTRQFPSEERYGLTNQIRRCAVSIPSNIAEGSARQTDKENIQFLYIALGSMTELETQLIIAKRLNYIQDDSILNQTKMIKAKMINYLKYLKSLKNKNR